MITLGAILPIVVVLVLMVVRRWSAAQAGGVGALVVFASDARILALLFAWFFVLFMEGVAGFGSSVALAALFLVAAGFRPVEASASRWSRWCAHGWSADGR